MGEAIDKHVAEHGTTSDGYLFQGRKYKLVVRRSYQEDFQRAAVRAGLPPEFIPNLLRHLYASTAPAEAIPITEVSRWLGATIATSAVAAVRSSGGEPKTAARAARWADVTAASAPLLLAVSFVKADPRPPAQVSLDPLIHAEETKVLGRSCAKGNTVLAGARPDDCPGWFERVGHLELDH